MLKSILDFIKRLLNPYRNRLVHESDNDKYIPWFQEDEPWNTINKP